MAALALKDNRIRTVGKRVGTWFKVGDVDDMLATAENAIGDAHYHPGEPPVPPFGSWGDKAHWVWLSLGILPPHLNQLSFVVFDDNSAGWYMFPDRRVVARFWDVERLKVEAGVKKSEDFRKVNYIMPPAACAQMNTFHELWRAGRIRCGHFVLGEREQIFRY